MTLDIFAPLCYPPLLLTKPTNQMQSLLGNFVVFLHFCPPSFCSFFHILLFSAVDLVCWRTVASQSSSSHSSVLWSCHCHSPKTFQLWRFNKKSTYNTDAETSSRGKKMINDSEFIAICLQYTVRRSTGLTGPEYEHSDICQFEIMRNKVPVVFFILWLYIKVNQYF